MPSNAKEHAAHTVRTSNDIKRDVREMTEKMLSEDGGLAAVGDVAGAVLAGAAQGLKDAGPLARSQRMREVLAGLDEAFAALADATAKGLKHARDRGEKFARTDVKKLAGTLRGMEEQFFSAVGHFAKKAGDAAGAEAGDALAELKKTGTKVKAAGERAAKAADGHVVSLATEAAGATARAAKGVMSGLLLSASGVLEGLGKASRPAKSTARPASKKTASKPAKKTGKRTAKRAAAKKKKPAKR